jgi:hypothetical protein
MKSPSHQRRPSLRIPFSYGFGYLRRTVNSRGRQSVAKFPNRWNMSDVFNVLFRNGFLRPLFFPPPTLCTASDFPQQSQRFVCAM